MKIYLLTWSKNQFVY